MTSERIRRIVLVAAAVLWVGALFGLASGSLSRSPATTATTAPVTDTTAAASGATIEILGFSFGDPQTVAVGATVTVVNRDSASHTWTANDATFDSGVLGGGEQFAFTFPAAGEYRFFCVIHPEMSGTITVTG